MRSPPGRAEPGDACVCPGGCDGAQGARKSCFKIPPNQTRVMRPFWAQCGGGSSAVSPAPGGVPPAPRRCSPRPRIASAYEQETLCTCSPGRGARGISSEWKEKAPPHPETVLVPSLRRRGCSLGVPLAGCPGGGLGGRSGDRLPPLGCRGEGCCCLRRLVGGRRLRGGEILLGKG